MMRTILILLLLSLSTGCVRYTCPAYASYFEFEEEEPEEATAEEVNQNDATMGQAETALNDSAATDSINEPVASEYPQRDKYLRGKKLSKRKKWQLLNTVEMKVDWPEDTTGQAREKAIADSIAKEDQKLLEEEEEYIELPIGEDTGEPLDPFGDQEQENALDEEQNEESEFYQNEDLKEEMRLQREMQNDESGDGIYQREDISPRDRNQNKEGRQKTDYFQGNPNSEGGF